MLSTFSNKTLSILIIVLINYWSDNSNMSVMSASVSDVCSVSSKFFFFLLVCFVIFYSKADIMYWVKGTVVNRSLVV